MKIVFRAIMLVLLGALCAQAQQGISPGDRCLLLWIPEVPPQRTKKPLDSYSGVPPIYTAPVPLKLPPKQYKVQAPDVYQNPVPMFDSNPYHQHRKNVYNGSDSNGVITVYSPDECIGPVIMGECKGSIIPKGGYHKTCYGQMLNGQCTGPMF